jgi:hypothetical protein
VQRRIITILTVALLIVAGPLTVNAGARQTRTGKTPPAKAKAKSESHQKLRAAISALEAAKAELEHADNDFGGHKAEAIDAINNALKRLRLALQFEKY